MGDEKNFVQILKYILLILVISVIIIPLGIFLAKTRLNLGGIFDWLLGKKRKNITPKVIGPDDKVVGQFVGIIENKDPLRDKTKLKLENGLILDLPKGLQDTDIEKVVMINEEIINIIPKHTVLTDVFKSSDSSKSSNG